MALLEVVLPPSCAGCGRFGALLCPGCRAAFRPATDGAHRFLAADGGIAVGEAFHYARAAFVYEGVLRRALQRLKYGGAARLARPLAAAAVPAFRGLVADVGALAVVPVPVHPQRLRERGYNQAALLGRELAAAAGLRVAEALERRRPTQKQHQLNRAARLRNLAGAFALAARARPPPEALLVDDIMTTSATLESCASVLAEAGTARIYGFVIAREL